MEVEVSCARITGVADICNDLSLSHKLSWYDPIGITLKVRIVKHQFLIGAELVNRCSTTFTLEELYDLAIGDSHNRGSGSSRNIDGIVDTSFGARVGEGVAQLVRPYAGHRNNQFQGADIISFRRKVYGYLCVC